MRDTWAIKSLGNHWPLCRGLAPRCNYFKAGGSFELCIINSGKQNQGVFIKCAVLCLSSYQTNVIWPSLIDPLEDQAIQAANSLCLNNEAAPLPTLQGFTFHSGGMPGNSRMFSFEEQLPESSLFQVFILLEKYPTSRRVEADFDVFIGQQWYGRTDALNALWLVVPPWQ